jgi:hypothetical protein
MGRTLPSALSCAAKLQSRNVKPSSQGTRPTRSVGDDPVRTDGHLHKTARRWIHLHSLTHDDRAALYVPFPAVPQDDAHTRDLRKAKPGLGLVLLQTAAMPPSQRAALVTTSSDASCAWMSGRRRASRGFSPRRPFRPRPDRRGPADDTGRNRPDHRPLRGMVEIPNRDKQHLGSALIARARYRSKPLPGFGQRSADDRGEGLAEPVNGLGGGGQAPARLRVGQAMM